jgi:hypothetical protein
VFVAIPALVDLFASVGRSRWTGFAVAPVGAALAFLTYGAAFVTIYHGPRLETALVFCSDVLFVGVVAIALLTGPRRYDSRATSADEYFLLAGAAGALIGFLLPWYATPQSTGGYDLPEGWALFVLAMLAGVGTFVTHRTVGVGQTVAGAIGLAYFIVMLAAHAEGALTGLYIGTLAYLTLLLGAIMRLRRIRERTTGNPVT